MALPAQSPRKAGSRRGEKREWLAVDIDGGGRLIMEAPPAYGGRPRGNYRLAPLASFSQVARASVSVLSNTASAPRAMQCCRMPSLA